MAENSGIEWTHHTFNPWFGCTKISPACDNCYAAEWNSRYHNGQHWGPHADRKRTGEKNWNLPRKWNKQAEKNGVRYRVFCSSLADVFDNHKSILPEWRADLWQLIRETPHLDWLLLTKRPQNIAKMLPLDWIYGYENVWLMTTVENQAEADKRIWSLLSVPAVVHGLSMEPLLSAVNIRPWLTKSPYGDCSGCTDSRGDDGTHSEGTIQHPRRNSISWVIAGGESGADFRFSNPDWFRSIRDQCQEAGVPFLFKQWGGVNQQTIKKSGRSLDGVIHDGYPEVRSL